MLGTHPGAERHPQPPNQERFTLPTQEIGRTTVFCEGKCGNLCGAQLIRGHRREEEEEGGVGSGDQSKPDFWVLSLIESKF